MGVSVREWHRRAVEYGLAKQEQFAERLREP